MRTEGEIKLKIGQIVKNLPLYQEKEKVISDLSTGFIDGLSWVLGQESILDNLASGDTFNKSSK